MTTAHPSWVAAADRSSTGRRPRAHRPSRSLALRLGAVAALSATAGTVAVTRPASAAAIDKKFSYTCNLPIVGPQAIPIRIKATFPDNITVGETIRSVPDADVTVPDNVKAALPIIGATSADLDSTLHTVWTGAVNATVDGRLQVTNATPPASGEWLIKGQADYPAIDATQPGTATVKVGDIDLVLTLKKPDGSLTGLGVVNTTCTLDPGQDPLLATVAIAAGGGQTPAPTDPPATNPGTPAPTTPPPTAPAGGGTTATTRQPTGTTAATAPRTPVSTAAPAVTTTISDTDATVPDYGGLVATYYKLNGQTVFNRLGDPSVLGSGSFKALLNLENGLWFGEFEFPEMVLEFRVMGVVPVRSTLRLQQVDPAYGKIDNGVATALAKAQINVSSVQIGRLTVPVGATCASSAPLDLTLASGPNFNPLAGGRVSGAFVIPSFVDCGLGQSITNNVIAGPGNRLELDLSPVQPPA